MPENIKFPIGQFHPPDNIGIEHVNQWLEEIESLPQQLSQLCGPLKSIQVGNSYRKGGWTIRQLLYHITDSHMHSYIRFKWALTEDNPLIKAYDEKKWAILNDTTHLKVADILDEIRIIQKRLTRVIASLEEVDLKKTFLHPESGKEISLGQLAGLYAWHGRHHLEHIRIAIKNPVINYVPVSCSFYDQLVLLAMRKTEVSVIRQDRESNPLHIKDILTSEKEEFVILSNGDKIRLDQITKLEGHSLYLRE